MQTLLLFQQICMACTRRKQMVQRPLKIQLQLLHIITANCDSDILLSYIKAYIATFCSTGNRRFSGSPMESNPIFDPFLLTLITLVLEDFPFSSHHLYLSYLLSKCYSFLTIQNPSHTFAKTAPVFTSFPSTVSTVDVFSFRVPEIALKAAIAEVRFTISVPIPTFPRRREKCRTSNAKHTI